ncbi:MAG: energy transducer TonB [Hyphomonadaceae bacterium]
MYGAMREHAPNSTRMAGLGAALLMTAAVGYALANGFIGHIAKLIEPPMIFTPIAEDLAPVDQPKRDLPIDVDGPTIPSLDIPKDIFVPDDGDDRIKTLPGDKRGLVEVGTVGGGMDRTASPVRTRPALITRTPPPYPAADIRRQNEGVTGIKVCLDASGRVTSANLGSSSGHTTLDNAALKWVRNARFSPAKSDGVAQAICDHDVFYEWKLENAR